MADVMERSDLEVVTIAELRTGAEDGRITVLVDLPHVAAYGHANTTLSLVYGCTFPVAVGDMVRCPPTPRYGYWTTGLVTALDGGTYRGPVKQVRPMHDEEEHDG